MTKNELSKLLHDLDIPVNEGISSKRNMNQYPRIIYWPYIEQDDMASGEEYCNHVTYQISMFSRTPQHKKYWELRRALRNIGIHPVFRHEYVENDPIFAKTWHTYFELEVTEDIPDE